MFLRCLVVLLLPSLATAQLSFSHVPDGPIEVTGHNPGTGIVTQPHTGPISLPLILSSLTTSRGTLSVTNPLIGGITTLRAWGTGQVVGPFATASASCSMRTRVTSPQPVRVRLTLVPAAGVGSNQILVDVGADNIIDYCQGATCQSGTLVHDLVVDSQGVLIDWHISCSVSSGWVVIPPTSCSVSLDMRFGMPPLESGYGAPCGAELGVVRAPSSPFHRTFLASFPPTTALAWIVIGNEPTNLTFPGVPCPLVCDPDVVAGVPLQSGLVPGRLGFEFTDQFPPILGASWFTQAVGFDAATGTFVGSNGVHIAM